MNEQVRRGALARHRESAFSRSMLARLNEIEIRPVRFGEDREELFRFRYRAYRAHGFLAGTDPHPVHDLQDDAQGAMLFALYHEGRMVSSIRMNLVTPDNRVSVSRIAFPDIIDPMLDDGATIIDPTRFTVCPEYGMELPQLSYVTVRLAAMASIHFDADYAFSLVRPRHGAFYRKVFGAKMIGGPRPGPKVDFDVCLYATEIREAFDRVFTQHPFFHSLESERRMLFGPKPVEQAMPQPRMPAWLTVLPTAELALAA